MYTCKKDESGWTTYIPKPEWRLKEEPFLFAPDQDAYQMTYELFFDEIRPKFWEIEEEILTGAVVDLLREKGYTVIEPGYRTL